MMIRRDGQRRQQRTKADKQIHTGLSNIHKYWPVNQTTLTGAIPFTPDSGSLPKDCPNGIHWGRRLWLLTIGDVSHDFQ
jgi:hypothetical protein